MREALECPIKQYWLSLSANTGHQGVNDGRITNSFAAEQIRAPILIFGYPKITHALMHEGP